MKRIVVLLLAILSVNLYSQEVIDIENDKWKKFNLKQVEVEYNEDGTIDKETGFMRINSSENFNSEYKEAKDIAMDYPEVGMFLLMQMINKLFI